MPPAAEVHRTQRSIAHRRRVPPGALVLLTVGLLSAASPARADDGEPEAAEEEKKPADDSPSWLPEWTGTLRRTGRYNEVGAFIGSTGSLGVSGRSSSSPQMGLRFFEHKGLITKFTMGLLTAIGTSGNKVVDSQETHTVGNMRVTTTTYHYKTAAEREADRRAVQSAINAEYITELQLYTDGLAGIGENKSDRVRGVDFYIGGMFTGPFVGPYPSVFDVAFLVSSNHANGVSFKDGTQHDVQYTNVGLMLRYHLPITSFFELFAQADVNVYGLLAKHTDANKVYGTPLRLGAYLNLTDRLYARPIATYTTGTGNGFGKVVEVGVRF